MAFQLQQFPLIPFTGESAPYVLVVVDPQPLGFRSAAARWLQTALLRELERAKRDGAPVVVLEMSPVTNGDTFEAFLTALRQAQIPSGKISKYPADGSAAVGEICRLGNFPTQQFRLCGVETDACVTLTAHGLLRLFPQATVEFAMGACNCQWDQNPWLSIRSGFRVKNEYNPRVRFDYAPSCKNRPGQDENL